MGEAAARDEGAAARLGRRVPRTHDRVIVYALLGIFVVLFIASIPDRQMHGDDAWLGEQAYWMSKSGHVRSDLFRGLLDYDQRQTIYHKLFILMGAAAIKMFGWSLGSIKMVSLVFYCIFVVTSYIYFTRNPNLFERRDFYVFSLIMISAPLIFRFAYVYRPEVMLMSLGFLSFCLLSGSLSGGPQLGHRQSLPRALAAGIFAGAGVLAHLNGWVFVAAGLVVLVSNRSAKSAAIFAVAASAVSALYFADLTSVENLRLFRYQLGNDLPIGEMPIWRRLLNVAYEHKRFFYSIREVFPSALLVLTVAFLWRTLVKSYRDVLVYLCVLVVGLAVLSRPRPSYYIIIYMPYIALVITVGLKRLGSLGTAKRAALACVLAAHFTFSLYYAVTVIRTATDLPRRNENIAASLPRGATIVAPGGFIFNQIANYRIQSLTFYDRYVDRRGSKLSLAEFFDLARSYGNSYVVVDQEFGRKIGLTAPNGGLRVGCYGLINNVQGTLIFRLLEAGT